MMGDAAGSLGSQWDLNFGLSALITSAEVP
jgi:hypothetical protein